MNTYRIYMLEPLTGLAFLLGALLLYLRPQSIVFSSIETAHGWMNGSLSMLFIVTFAGFGFALVFQRSTSKLAFGALSSPLFIYGLVTMYGVTKVPEASATGSYWFIVLYFIFQYAHYLVERLNRLGAALEFHGGSTSKNREI